VILVPSDPIGKFGGDSVFCSKLRERCSTNRTALSAAGLIRPKRSAMCGCRAAKSFKALCDDHENTTGKAGQDATIGVVRMWRNAGQAPRPMRCTGPSTVKRIRHPLLSSSGASRAKSGGLIQTSRGKPRRQTLRKVLSEVSEIFRHGPKNLNEGVFSHPATTHTRSPRR